MTSTGLVIVLAVAAGVSLVRGLLPRLPLPGPLLELLCGLMLGPTVFGLVPVDPLLSAVSVLGMSFVLFLAGYELDVRGLVGPGERPARTGLVISLVLAPIATGVLWLIGWDLRAAGLVACALLATSVGLVGPLLRDSGLATHRVGRLTLAGAALGEIAAIVAISVGFGAARTPLASLALLGVILALGALTAWVFAFVARSPRIRAAVLAQADGGGQARVRLAVLAVAGFALLASTLGLEAVLGAFLAGGLARLVDPDPETTHPGFLIKLDALGFGLLIPVFFVTSGLRLDLRPVLADPRAVLVVPVLLILLLAVRGTAALAYRPVLPARDVLTAGLLLATSLPFLLVAAEIGESSQFLDHAQAGALALTGVLSVVVLPTVAVGLGRRSFAAGVP
ncbi:cation:proton antiporter [Microlunatus ginsengisoli]|uniref:Cation:proton antiporter n=1 Tax=Microlunatus ginsengisoli TaxID=363863 RepID=A0ABP6ZR54_9ACTN